MGDIVHRLAEVGSFRLIHDKVERLAKDYKVNSNDSNVAQCCELIELSSKGQGQLFKLLNAAAAEGGVYGGASAIKNKLLPLLSEGLLASWGGDATHNLEMAAKRDLELCEIRERYEASLAELQTTLRKSSEEAVSLKTELEDIRDELDRTRSESVRASYEGEAENSKLRHRLAEALDRLRMHEPKLTLIDDYERQLRRLREDLAVMAKANGGTGYRTTAYDNVEILDNTSKGNSPLSPDDTIQRIRQTNLIARFNEMFGQDRLDAMDTLARYSSERENNQRIIFAALQESVLTAKISFRAFKNRVRLNLASNHTGPESLEEAVQCYINRNLDLYDLPGIVQDVIRSLNRNPKICLQPDASYTVINPFIRECSKLAWGMVSLAHPLDIAVATDAELFDESKYRRSYDSEYTAPLVNHHIWPCVMQGTRVLVKGECLTRRGASLNSSRRSRSRSVSPSPRGCGLSSGGSSRLFSLDGVGGGSGGNPRSPSPTSASTALSSSSTPAPRHASPTRRSLSPSRAAKWTGAGKTASLLSLST